MTTFTISGDVATLLGGDHKPGDPVALWVECSQSILVVGATGLLGGRLRATVASDGTFSVADLPASVGDLPLYRLVVDSRSLRLAGNPRGLTTGWFPLTADRDLTWIVANYVTVTVVTAATATNVAAAAALGATNDTATASYVNNPASATAVALAATYASKAGAETLTNKTVSADSNALNGFPASSFVVTDGTGKADGAAAQKVVPAGVVVGTTDAQTLTNKDLTSSTNTFPTSLPRGTLGYAQATSSQSGISAADLTSLSAAVTVGTSRRIRVSVFTNISMQTASNRAFVQIQEGATVLAVARMDIKVNEFGPMCVSVILTPSSGAHTYKATAQVLAGSTITSNASATEPAYILVEDIGT